jgi:hypothetical protein
MGTSTASAAAPDAGARLGREHEAIVAEIIGRRVAEWGFAVARDGNVLTVRLGRASYRVTVTAEGPR